MNPVLDRANEIVSTTNTTDFVVQSHSGDTLLLTGSFDHSFYHEVEIHFHVVSYIGLPTHGIDSPRFSIATHSERNLRKHLELEETDILYCIHTDPELGGRNRYYVAAERMSVVEGIVFYYHRENLKPGERIAEWVNREG